ncbi:FMN-dependent NADH-azoreductase [Propionibacteriaceae bacterium Y1923]|uniref:FMN-dependent NADH-azoreductase n=1 Tax=Aestuariimicrobium sp. Y1814 TaxID=3418742 RepID=UPI003C1A7D0E
MAQLLVVRAHPLDSSSSRSMQLTDAFVTAYTEAHPDDRVEQLHLYDVAVPEIDLDLLNGWKKLAAGEPFVHLHPSEQAKLTIFDQLGDQFMGADKFVVANPLWNLSVPTRLKAWIDTVCRAGRTFRYTSDGRAEGLVKGKRGLHLQTNGGFFGGADPASDYLRRVFGFIGVSDYQSMYAEGMDHDPDNAAAIMAEAIDRVTEFARTF